MANDPEAVATALNDLLQPNARGRLLARGLARGMVWRNGVVPQGGPVFAVDLTPDLLDLGYSILVLALELRDVNLSRDASKRFDTDTSFRVAAESIESAARRSDRTDPDRGRHLVVAAASFHLGGFSARAFSLLETMILTANLSSAELTLALLLRRDFVKLRDHVHRWLGTPEHQDEGIAAKLLADGDFDLEDVEVNVLTAMYHQAVGRADTALLFGDATFHASAIGSIDQLVSQAAELGNLAIWWVAMLTRHLLRDLWDRSLHQRLPSNPLARLPEGWNDLRGQFIDALSLRDPPQIDLWPSQIDAASRSCDETDHLVVALPTSAGKTRIAELCILRTLAGERRIIYVTPLRALSAQVEQVLARTFCPLGATVTALYGASGTTDVDQNTLTTANVVVATPEKLDFAVRQDPAVLDDVGLIVFDEGHMIGLGSREVRYEVLIQRLLRRADAGTRRIVCLSAMFNPEDELFQDFGNWLRSDNLHSTIHVKWRPTRQLFATLEWQSSGAAARLSFIEGEKPFVPRFLEQQLSSKKPRKGQAPKTFPRDDKELCIAAADTFAKDGHSILVYSPERRLVEPFVRAFVDAVHDGYVSGVKAPTAADIAVALAIGREWLGPKHDAVRGLEIGVGAHHGALPRPFQSAVEDLLARQKLAVVVASPTLAQGVDLSCSVLIFRSLYRYDARASPKRAPIDAAQFANVIGRAGRAYVDVDGISVYPIFGPVSTGRADFQRLLDSSRGQKLQSGLSQLIMALGRLLSERLSVSHEKLLEYVLNQRELWSDKRLGVAEEDDGDDEPNEDSLAAYLSDLDVAILSIVDPLDLPVEYIAATLDAALHGSLWERTLVHAREEIRKIEREVLCSRAEWLWRTTTADQRRACFMGGLGSVAGVFLYDHIDELVSNLAVLEAAIGRSDAVEVSKAAVSFAQVVMVEPFFAMKKIPRGWDTALMGWVSGTALADILTSREVAVFINDHVAFKMVWAAEAVRAQAVAREHTRAGELGDGPALAFTHGVPSRQAALLCQSGFASRTGAVWAARSLAGSFSDMFGLRVWEHDNADSLVKTDFWETPDQHLLWAHRSSRQTSVSHAAWSRWSIVLQPTWFAVTPDEGTSVRIVDDVGGGTVCSVDLAPLGAVAAKPAGTYHLLRGTVQTDGSVAVWCFGPKPWPG